MRFHRGPTAEVVGSNLSTNHFNLCSQILPSMKFLKFFLFLQRHKTKISVKLLRTLWQNFARFLPKNRNWNKLFCSIFFQSLWSFFGILKKSKTHKYFSNKLFISWNEWSVSWPINVLRILLTPMPNELSEQVSSLYNCIWHQTRRRRTSKKNHG